MNDLAALLPLVAILALFWFMVIRPQQRRQKEVAALQHGIQVGQRLCDGAQQHCLFPYLPAQHGLADTGAQYNMRHGIH